MLPLMEAIGVEPISLVFTNSQRHCNCILKRQQSQSSESADFCRNKYDSHCGLQIWM